MITLEFADGSLSIFAVLGCGGVTAAIWLLVCLFIREVWNRYYGYAGNFVISIIGLAAGASLTAVIIWFLRILVMYTENAWIYDAVAAVAGILFVLGVIMGHIDSKKDKEKWRIKAE